MTVSLEKQAPLEDLMAAMDVVDTLRHQAGIAERELDGEGRRERLLLRLRELYHAQGIDVPDHVLQEGIDALEQERFQYHPVAKSWRTRVAGAWVSRKRWVPPVSILTVLIIVLYSIYVFMSVLPENRLRASIPAALDASFNTITVIAKNPQIIEQARTRVAQARQALADDELDKAQQIQSEIEVLREHLRNYYSIRVVSRQGEMSGVWRIPDINSSSRNHYLIVEAVNRDNRVVALEILNEETNLRQVVKTWGIRVDETTFNRIAADKQDDGIIQGNQVGEKQPGYLEPTFSIPTSGGKITKWD